jgi:hypothetical protein
MNKFAGNIISALIGLIIVGTTTYAQTRQSSVSGCWVATDSANVIVRLNIGDSSTIRFYKSSSLSKSYDVFAGGEASASQVPFRYKEKEKSYFTSFSCQPTSTSTSRKALYCTWEKPTEPNVPETRVKHFVPDRCP